MALTLLLTGAGLIECALAGFIGNRFDASAKSAVSLVRNLAAKRSLPENHHVSKAMAKAFRLSMLAIADVCGMAGSEFRQIDYADKILQFAQSKELKDWSFDLQSIKYDLLEGRVRAIYGHADATMGTCATNALIDLVEAAIECEITPELRGVFLYGYRGKSGWADYFELFFADEVKNGTELSRIIQFDRSNELVARAEELRALAADQAEQINELKIKIELLAPLAAGISQLEIEASDADNFRDYLHSSKLAYFSRDSFNTEMHEIAGSSEQKLKGFLLAQRASALVLSGPGGVGKTRLALELGRSLASDHSWLVLMLDRRAKSAAIESLIRKPGGPKKVALVLDYGEVAEHLDDIAMSIRALAEEDIDLQIGLIVTCRSSAVARVEDAVEALEVVKTDLTARDVADAGYQQWLVDKILASRALPDKPVLARVCHGVPVLAAFAVYLFDNHRDRFDRQFASLLTVDDFAEWINHRVRALAGTSSRKIELLAELALSLPMLVSERDAIVDQRDEKALLFGQLEQDCWVETVDGFVFAAHDVLADGLAACWLFKNPRLTTDRTRDALRRALDQDRLDVALVAMDRLAAQPGFAEIDGHAVVSHLFEISEQKLADQAYLLLAGRMIDVWDKLFLATSGTLIPEACLKTSGMRMTLLKVASDFADEESDDDTDEAWYKAAARLRPLVDRALILPAASNILVRRACRFDPVRYRDLALRNIDTFPFASQTHFLLVELLRNRENVEELSTRVVAWLDANASADIKASFVLRAWYKAGGDHALIADQAIKWLDTFYGDISASFALNSYLMGGGKVALVQDHVKAWLSKFAARSEAWSVYAGWLFSTGEIKLIRLQFIHWLSEHDKTYFACQPIMQWLDRTGETTPVQTHMLNWLGDFSANFQAGRVMTRWLLAGGELEPIEKSALGWLDIYKSELRASFLIDTWLKVGGELAKISSYAFEWLHLYCTKPEAAFLTKSLTTLKELPPQVLIDICTWATTFKLDPDSLWRLSRLGSKLQLADDHVRATYANACAVCVEAHIDTPRTVSELSLANLFAQIGIHLEYVEDDDYVCRSAAKVVQSGVVFTADARFNLPFRSENFFYLLLDKRWLDLDLDREAISSFLEFIRAAHQKPIYWERTLASLSNRFPEIDWPNY